MKLFNSTKLLTIGKPNLNGRLYTEECINGALEKLSGRPLFITASSDGKVPSFVESLGTASNLRVEGGLLVGDIQVFESLLDITPGLAFCTGGTGKCNMKDVDGVACNVVEDFELTHIIATNDPA